MLVDGIGPKTEKIRKYYLSTTASTTMITFMIFSYAKKVMAEEGATLNKFGNNPL